MNSTIKVIGSKGNGKLDLTAERENESWRYEKINIRIKGPEKKKKTIEIIKLQVTPDNLSPKLDLKSNQ